MMSTEIALQVTPLNRKAMLVKLTCNKPNTSRREDAITETVQAQFGDNALTVSLTLFKSKDNPVRKVLNEAGEVYTYHVTHTLPWSDRGPRMLPVSSYETYTTEMRALISKIESAVHALIPQYDQLVQNDIDQRNARPITAGRAKVEDYPTKEEFADKMKFEFVFSPLPDASHFLFDVSEEDKAKLTDQLAEVEKQAKNDVAARIHTPLVHLVNKLKVPVGQAGAIFRDSAVENVVDACEIVKQLAMGDETVLAMVEEVRAAIAPSANNIDSLRESPIVREQAAAKLEAVAKKMNFMFGN
jgi:hypothetical protein